MLLTDFSSIYIDYLLLNKPIGFLISDFEQYSNSRGFVFKNPKEFMPGEIITKRDELIPFIEKVLCLKQDDFEEKKTEMQIRINSRRCLFERVQLDSARNQAQKKFSVMMKAIGL